MMNGIIYVLVFTICTINLSCQTTQESTAGIAYTNTNRSANDSIVPNDLPDFANFTYPATKKWDAIKLVDGKSLATIGPDGKVNSMGYTLIANIKGELSKSESCSIVVLNVLTGGSAVVHIVYLFDTSKNSPRLIWSLASGDRADGGLRNIYFENSLVTLETYESRESQGDCCPKTYKKEIYFFNNDVPRLVKRVSNLPNPDHNAIFIGGNPLHSS